MHLPVATILKVDFCGHVIFVLCFVHKILTSSYGKIDHGTRRIVSSRSISTLSKQPMHLRLLRYIAEASKPAFCTIVDIE